MFDVDDFEDLEINDFITEQLILEGEIDDKTNRAEEQISRMFEHLLKLEYQPERQGVSWYNSIFGSYDEITKRKYLDNKNVKNRINLDDCYDSGRKEASKQTGIPLRKFPEQRPNNWNLDYVTDINKLVKYVDDRYDYQEKSFKDYLDNRKSQYDLKYKLKEDRY